MITVNRLNKPKILTETDRLLSDLSGEMSDLHERMALLEKRQQASQTEITSLQEQQKQQQLWIEKYQKEVAGHHENYQVIADIMHSLKEPVSAVIGSLEEIIGSIADEEVKLSLDSCVKEAMQVLNSFEHVEGFCQDLSRSEVVEKKEVTLHTMLQNIIEPLQKQGIAVELSFAQDVPPTVTVNYELYSKVLQRLCAEVLKVQLNKKVILRVGADNQNDQTYLQINLDLEEPAAIQWDKTWVRTICNQYDKFLYSGLNILKINSLLRQDGTELDARVSNDNLAGFCFSVPI